MFKQDREVNINTMAHRFKKNIAPVVACYKEKCNGFKKIHNDVKQMKKETISNAY